MQFKKCVDVCVRVHRRVASEDEGLCVCVSAHSRKARRSIHPHPCVSPGPALPGALPASPSQAATSPSHLSLMPASPPLPSQLPNR